MTKQDILNLKTSEEIARTIKTHPELWDDEINNHLIKTARRENLEKYDCELVLVDPPKRKIAD